MAIVGLESIVQNKLLSVVGDPLYAGLIFIGFFVVLTYAIGTKSEGKFVILVPAAILTTAMIPAFAGIIGLVGGYVAFTAVMKLMNR